ncbi:MAG: triose-phosphate isomerase [Rickettsiales bacterium]|nr:triose-phosphate isomerase [Rickettsiales bacterium]
MAQNTLIVSNWKMNLNLISAKKLISKLRSLKISKNIKNIICPQYLLIPHVRKLIKNSQIILGAQDCHFEEQGSFTGDSSISLIRENGCKYVIIGHSERREFHKEENLDVKKKIKTAIKNYVIPIVCVGEPSLIRQNNSYLKFICNQIEECIPKKLEKLTIAYEPIWAIGSGLTPTIDDIIEVKECCVDFLKKTKKIKDIKFLYGGSVNSKNFFEIRNECKIDGALIGGASLIEKEITNILKGDF